jgi:hypothetical protein
MVKNPIRLRTMTATMNPTHIQVVQVGRKRGGRGIDLSTVFIEVLLAGG